MRATRRRKQGMDAMKTFVFCSLLLAFIFCVKGMPIRDCAAVPPGNANIDLGNRVIEQPPADEGAAGGTLYGYYYDTTTSSNVIYSINPSTGATSPVCSIKSPYVLTGSSQATNTKEGLLLFTTQDPSSDPKPKGYIASVNPKSCGLTLTPVVGMAKQATFLKYDNLKGNLYMAFQNPFCIHSSLYQIDPSTGKVLKKLGNVVVGETAYEHVGMDTASQSLYYTYEDYTGFYLSRVDLKTGNITNARLNFKPIGGGAQWIYNTFTLDYVPYPNAWGSGIVTGVASFNNASSPCYPVGVFAIAPGSDVSMVCLQRLPTVKTINMATDEAPGLGYFYQLLDGTTLLTYDAKNSKTVSTVTCSACASFASLAYLSS